MVLLKCVCLLPSLSFAETKQGTREWAAGEVSPGGTLARFAGCKHHHTTKLPHHGVTSLLKHHVGGLQMQDSSALVSTACFTKLLSVKILQWKKKKKLSRKFLFPHNQSLTFTSNCRARKVTSPKDFACESSKLSQYIHSKMS